MIFLLDSFIVKKITHHDVVFMPLKAKSIFNVDLLLLVDSGA